MRLHLKIVLLVLALAIPLGVVSLTFTERLSEYYATLAISLVSNGRLHAHVVTPEGVPLVGYPKMGGAHPNPVYAGMYGLSYYDLWLESGENEYFLDYYQLYLPEGEVGEEVWKDRFLNIADWYVDNMVIRENEGQSFGVWEYDTPWPTYELSPYWISGMAQGIALQVLVRGWLLTQDSTYLQAMDLASQAFYVEVIDGGVTLKDEEDRWWYEEYAAPNAVESRVLNGHEHALIALYECYVYTGEERYRKLFDKGMRALKTELASFDAPDQQWTWYDQVGNLANRKYHHINANLTKRIGAWTGDRQLIAVGGAWVRYDDSLLARELHRDEISERFVVMVLLNIFISFMGLIAIIYGVLGFKRLGQGVRTEGIT